MTLNESSTVLWISNLADVVSSNDVINLFEKYGPVHEVQIKGSFCKIEFENRGDAKKARYGLDSVDFHGRRLSVDWFRGEYHESLLQGRNWWGGRPGAPRLRRRVYILNLPCHMERSRLLNLAWEAGNSVIFLDVIACAFDEQSFVGIVEYSHEIDYKYALTYLDGMEYERQKLRWISSDQYQEVEKRFAHRIRPLRPIIRPGMTLIHNGNGITPNIRPPGIGNYIGQTNMNALMSNGIRYGNRMLPHPLPPPPTPPSSLGLAPLLINSYNTSNKVEPMHVDRDNDLAYTSTSNRHGNTRNNDTSSRYRYNTSTSTQNFANNGQGHNNSNNSDLTW